MVRKDQFTFTDRNYADTIDYYSNFWEIDYLEYTQARTMIWKPKLHFAKYSIPDILCSDNRPQ